MTRRLATYPLVALAAVVAAAGSAAQIGTTAHYALGAVVLVVAVAGALVWSERLVPRLINGSVGHPISVGGARSSSAWVFSAAAVAAAAVVAFAVGALTVSASLGFVVFAIVTGGFIRDYMLEWVVRRSYRSEEKPPAQHDPQHRW